MAQTLYKLLIDLLILGIEKQKASY